ncbi:MAG TPA: wax ester/triacylglycerol synthase domain-containing protein [Acidimicrobiales bacterium]|nr:wax ester/triacylglycerol synthase domain-containing protein [Acidimicrobiales bacterium]
MSEVRTAPHNGAKATGAAETRAVAAMSDSDALLWTIDRDPVLRPTISAVVLLEGEPDWDTLQARVEQLTRDVGRLRSRVVLGPLPMRRPRWEPVERFDLSFHLHRMRLSEPADLRSLLDLAQQMGSTSFDPELPLWEATLVEGLDGGRSGLVIKLHHAMIDGVGGLAVAAQLFDREDGTPLVDGGPADDGLGRRGRGPIGRAIHLGLLPARLGIATARAACHPLSTFRRVQATAVASVELLAPAPHRLSPLMQGASFVRNFEIFDLPFRPLYEAGAAAGGTLNDAFVAGILGGLGEYHRRHEAAAPGLRLLMPVSIRRPDDPISTNRFVPARFVVPADIADPGHRLQAVHRIAGGWKHTPALGLTDAMAKVLGRLPAPVAAGAFSMMLKGSDFVATNVAGPPFETWLAGAHVQGFYAFSPPSGAAVNVSLLTLAERACFGVNIDPAAVPDSQELAGCLRRGLEEVAELAGKPPRRPASATRR